MDKELRTPSHTASGERKGKWKGTITILIYEDAPAETQFEGDIKGWDISVAWRAMMKGYRVWKASLAKEPVSLRKGGK